MAATRLVPSTAIPVGLAPLADIRYLTDGRRLFRLLTRAEGAALAPLTTLEDCLTLQLRVFAPDELYELRLRPVAVSA